jgi:hypothetical protein
MLPSSPRIFRTFAAWRSHPCKVLGIVLLNRVCGQVYWIRWTISSAGATTAPTCFREGTVTSAGATSASRHWPISLPANSRRATIAKGDAVLLWSPNCAEWVAAFLGCALCGVVAVPVDDAASPDFARRISAQVRTRAGVCPRERAAIFEKSKPSIPPIWLCRRRASFRALSSRSDSAFRSARNRFHLRHHGRAQGSRAHPRQRGRQPRPDRNRDQEISEVRAAGASDSLLNLAAAEPRLRPIPGNFSSSAARRHGRVRKHIQPDRSHGDDPPRTRLGAGGRPAHDRVAEAEDRTRSGRPSR